MNKTSFNPRILLMSLAVCGMVQLAGAAGTTLWSGAGADQDWSTPGNWTALTGSAPPAAGDTAVFPSNAGAPTSVTTVDTIISADTTVASLLYTNTAPTTHNTQINANQTLTVNGAFAVEFASANLSTVAAMSGTGNFIVNTATGNFTVGGPVAPATMTLADGTNQVTAVTLSIGESGGSNGRQANLNLGNGTNMFYVNAVNLGTGKAQGKVQFAGADGGLLIAGTNGTGRVSAMLMGSGTSGSGSANGQLLLAGHPANILASNLTMGVLGDTGNQTANIAMDNGTFDVTSIIMGRTANTQASGVNSTFTLGGSDATATLIVNASTFGATGGGSFIIADSTLGTGTINGTLTINQNGVAQIYCPITKARVSNNNATIALNSGGMLIMESAADTIGTPAIPIDNVTLGGGTLQLSIAGATPEVVAGTLNVNAATTVNIAALPVIVHYPAQFPLIQYSASSGDLTMIALGTLPAGSPPYQGYISNNVDNFSVDLVVTNGFAPTGVDIWTGTTDTNWDLIAANWSLSGGSAVFFNGSIVQFDDTVVSATNVNIALDVTPATMTVSNFTKAYNFSGPGGILGSASLTKDGDNALVFANTGTNTFSGGITINAGSVQFGTGGTGGNLPANAQPIMDDGNLVLNFSNNPTVSGAISGAGNLWQNGSGVVSLAASNSYSGATIVNSGSLMVDGYIGGGGVVSNAVGTTLGGNGTNIGPLNASGIISPGDANASGTYSVVGDATLSAGAAVALDLNAADPTIGNNVNDLLQVAGNLGANNNRLSVNIRGVPQTGFSYGVITYSGALSGSFNSTVAGTHFAATVDTSTPNQVNVNITGTGGANLKWTSTSGASWDNAAQNWLNLGTSLADNFYSGDTVLLDDSVANVVTNIVIPSGITVYPVIITNVSSANSYTISGGAIGGAASIVKDGTGTLTISNANSFTGEVDVYAGTLMTGSGTALGTTAAGTVISSGATLDVNGQNLGSEVVTVSGTGVGGLGALVNRGAQQINAFKNVTLTGDTTFGGTGRWDIRGGSATLQANGSPVNITKTGTNQISLVACVCSDVNLENLNILQGVFAIQTTSTQFGDPAGFINVSSNALLNLYNLTAGLDKNIVLPGGGGIWTENSSTTISGTVTLTNTVGQGILTNQSSTTLIVNSVISGPGSLVKRGAGTTQLATVNAYTGSTSVGGGTLQLAAPGAIDTSPSVSVSAGATLDVTAIAPWNLATGQTLLGSGTVNGDVTVPSSSTISPGSSSAIGTLAVSGNVILSGTNAMKLDRTSGATNDVLSATGAMTLGGTLNISLLGGTFAGGDTFILFSAAGGISGAFSATNLPALPAGFFWVATNLVNGVLSIGSTVNLNPASITASVSGSVLSLSWPADHTGWRLLVQTNNLASGLSADTNDWTTVAGSAGINQTNIMMDPTKPAEFYRLVYP